MARHRGARPFGPADGAARARRRQRPLSAPGPVGAGAVPHRQAAAADRAGGHDPRRRDAQGPRARRPADRRLARASRGRARARSTSRTTAIAGMRLGIDLLKPPALFPNMTGKSVRMVWTLDGPFATADYSYRLTSPIRAVRQDRLHRLARRRARAPGALADARADPPSARGDHRRRRRRRRDARQPQDRRLADGHAQAGARRRT